MKIELPASLDQFVAEKIKLGGYVSADEVIRDSLRRWKEQEEGVRMESAWLERELQEGLESEEYPSGKAFWGELRDELHGEHKVGKRRR